MRAKRVCFGVVADDYATLEVSGDVTASIDFMAATIAPLASGDVVYMGDDIAHIVALLRSVQRGFIVGGPEKIVAATIDGVRFLPYSAWDCDNREQLEETFRDCFRADIAWHTTAGATVAALAPSTGALAHRWRPLMEACLHSGPILHTRGGCANGTHIDRSGAYLQSLKGAPMPDSAPWRLDKPGMRGLFRDSASILCATVRVFHTEHTADMPPLPVRMRGGGAAWPVGEFQGVWPAYMLERAVACGEAEVLHVRYRVSPSRLTTAWKDMAERIESLPKPTRKALYTRVWGKLVSRGGMTGTYEHVPGAYYDRMSGLWWASKDTPQWANLPRYYRPDVAAQIVCRNAYTMTEAVRALAPGSLVGCYVDSIWTEDNDGADRLLAGGGWKLEGRGRIRMVSPGRYAVHDVGGTYYGHAGTGPVESEAELSASVSGQRAPWGRGWRADPRTDERATSVPSTVEGFKGAIQFEGYEPDSEVWEKSDYLPRGFNG